MIWHTHRLRVRYQETDQMGVVFYGNYMTWFEIGRTELVRQHGSTYADIEAAGLFLPVIDVHAKYVAAAKYDESIILCTAIAELTPLKVQFLSQARRIAEGQHVPDRIEGDEQLPGQLLVHGGTTHVWVSKQFRPTRMNVVYPELYERLKKVAHSYA